MIITTEAIAKGKDIYKNEYWINYSDFLDSLLEYQFDFEQQDKLCERDKGALDMILILKNNLENIKRMFEQKWKENIWKHTKPLEKK